VFATGTADGHPWQLAVQDIADPGYACLPAITINGTDADPVYLGPETIMALPLGYPNPDSGAIGYALQVSPATAELDATLSNGSTHPVTLSVVAGRKYAAFAVGTSLRLRCLTWRNAAGHVFASTTRLPLYGYIQFQP
jgi:hypothetical protein